MSKHHFRPSARLLAQTATIVLVASLAGACSGGVERFDDPIFTGNTDNQRALLNGKPGRSAGLRRPGCGPRSRPLRAAFGASSRLRSEQHCLDRVDPQPEAGRFSSGEVRCACVNRAEPAAGEAGRDDAGAKRFGGRGAAHRSRLDDRWRNAGVGRAGDTVKSMSRRYGIPPYVLADINGVSADAAFPAGQRVTIPTYVHGAPSTARTAASQPVTLPPPEARPP